MIDTIRIYTNDHTRFDLKQLQSRYAWNHATYNDSELFTTQIKNLELRFTNHNVSIEGSAPAFIRNSNVETLKLPELSDFIGELSEAVGCDVSDFTITRIDVTDNLELSQAPRSYKRYFGKCRYYQRVDFENNGLQYINNSRKLTLYDKILEQDKKGKIVPENYRGKNLLRFEYSIMRNRNEYLGDQINTLADLSIQGNYLTLIERWAAQFNNIERVTFQSRLDMPYHPGLKFPAYAMLVTAKDRGGIENLLSEFDEHHSCGYMTARQHRYLRRNLIQYQAKYNQLAGVAVDRNQELIAKMKSKVSENRELVYQCKRR